MGYAGTLSGVFAEDKTKPSGTSYRAAWNNPPLRVLGLTTYPVRFNGEQYVGKHSQLFNTMARHYDLVDVCAVKLEGWRKWHQRAVYFRPNRSAWITASNMNVMAFEERSRRAEAMLKAHDGKYDLIFQLHTMMSPGLNLGSRPYVLATDNTYRLSERCWSDWVPVKRDREAWIRHETEVYQNATCIFTWSEFARQSIIQEYGIAPQNVIVTGSAGGFPITDLTKINYSGQFALFVGNDFERKGGFVLLKAWEKVLHQLPDAQLWIVGPPEPLAAPMPGVKWLGRIADRAALKRIFDQASTFVMPSLFEPFAIAMLEAMGAGLPVIGAKSGGIPEMIVDDYNGYLVEPGEVDALAQKLITLLANPEQARAMGQRAHYSAREQYTWDRILNRMSLHIERSFAAKAVTVPMRPRELMGLERYNPVTSPL
jgi:glycosyltransferase involved in cell wall biosynthesis